MALPSILYINSTPLHPIYQWHSPPSYISTALPSIQYINGTPLHPIHMWPVVTSFVYCMWRRWISYWLLLVLFGNYFSILFWLIYLAYFRISPMWWEKSISHGKPYNMHIILYDFCQNFVNQLFYMAQRMRENLWHKLITPVKMTIAPSYPTLNNT